MAGHMFLPPEKLGITQHLSKATVRLRVTLVWIHTLLTGPLRFFLIRRAGDTLGPTY